MHPGAVTVMVVILVMVLVMLVVTEVISVVVVMLMVVEKEISGAFNGGTFLVDMVVALQ